MHEKYKNILQIRQIIKNWTCKYIKMAERREILIIFTILAGEV